MLQDVCRNKVPFLLKVGWGAVTSSSFSQNRVSPNNNCHTSLHRWVSHAYSPLQNTKNV